MDNNNIIELVAVSTGFSWPARGANRSQSPLCKQIGGNKIQLFIISSTTTTYVSVKWHGISICSAGRKGFFESSAYCAGWMDV